MVHTIENDFFRVSVRTRGAEICSAYSKKYERELIWQGDKAWFPRQANNLFPACGAVVDNEIVIDGKTYPLSQHGFARDYDFVLSERTDSKLVFLLDGATKNADGSLKFGAHYPYAFKLYIIFELCGDKIKQTYKVENCDEGEIQFGIGSHTGFFCPLEKSERAEDCVLSFGKDNDCLTEHLRVGDNSHRSGKKETVKLENGEYPLSDDCFNEGAHIYEGFKSKSCKLLSKKSGMYVQVDFEGFPIVVIWSRAGKTRYVCIEPWCGLPDRVDTDKNFLTKEGNSRLQSGETFSREMIFSVGKQD